MEENKNDELQRWTEIGANIAGSTISSIVGIFNPTIEGAFIGSTTGAIVTNGLQQLGKEMRARLISNQEEKRIGTSFFYLQEKFNENIAEGKTVRDDVFFDQVTGEYTRNTEILEGVLIAAQRSYEERKVRYISYFYANVIFDKNWDTYHANHFLRLAESMSYRQFCLLAVYYYGPDFELDKGNYSPTLSDIRYDTITDLLTLKDKAFIGLSLPLKNDGKFFMFPPDNAFLTKYGLSFCELFGLNQIPSEDILEVASHLVTAKKIEEMKAIFKP